MPKENLPKGQRKRSLPKGRPKRSLRKEQRKRSLRIEIDDSTLKLFRKKLRTDPSFMKAIADDPKATLQEYGIHIDEVTASSIKTQLANISSEVAPALVLAAGAPGQFVVVAPAAATVAGVVVVGVAIAI